MELVRGQKGRIRWSGESRIWVLEGRSALEVLVRGVLGLMLCVSVPEQLDVEVLERT